MADRPAAIPAGLNLLFFVGHKWALYGAPRESRLDQAAFEDLAKSIRDIKFPSSTTQVVVMVRDTQVEGTIGLVEKRGLRVSSLLVQPHGSGPFEVWHKVGYRVSPDKIVSDFQGNILAAEATYRDLPVTFTGQVKRVGKDPGGQVFVEMDIKSSGASFLCYPWAELPQQVELNTLRSGDRLETSGQFAEFSNNTVKIRSCLFTR